MNSQSHVNIRNRCPYEMLGPICSMSHRLDYIMKDDVMKCKKRKRYKTHFSFILALNRYYQGYLLFSFLYISKLKVDTCTRLFLHIFSLLFFFFLGLNKFSSPRVSLSPVVLLSLSLSLSSFPLPVRSHFSHYSTSLANGEGEREKFSKCEYWTTEHTQTYTYRHAHTK